MAVPASSPLLILPKGSRSVARVSRVCCGGEILVDLSSPRALALVVGLADVPHRCPQADLEPNPPAEWQR